MSRHLARWLPPFVAALSFSLWGCGPAITDAQDMAAVVAHSSIPAPFAQGSAYARLAAGADSLPQPALTFAGRHGGEVRLEFNLVGAAVGLVGEGLLFNVAYHDWSDDGLLRLDGNLAMLANFAYVPQTETEDPYANLRLSAVGRVRVSGVYHDELHANVTVTTRIGDLEARDGGADIQLRLDGWVEANEQRFEFHQEDLLLAWDRFAQEQAAR